MQKKKEKLTRSYKITLMLNEREMKALNKFEKKYKIVNRAKFIREVMFKHILEQFDKDYPRIFPEE